MPNSIVFNGTWIGHVPISCDILSDKVACPLEGGGGSLTIYPVVNWEVADGAIPDPAVEDPWAG